MSSIVPFQSAFLASGRVGSSLENESGSTSFRISSSCWVTANGTELPAGSSPGIGAIRVSKSRIGGDGIDDPQSCRSLPEPGPAGSKEVESRRGLDALMTQGSTCG